MVPKLETVPGANKTQTPASLPLISAFVEALDPFVTIPPCTRSTPNPAASMTLKLATVPTAIAITTPSPVHSIKALVAVLEPFVTSPPKG